MTLCEWLLLLNPNSLLCTKMLRPGIKYHHAMTVTDLGFPRGVGCQLPMKRRMKGKRKSRKRQKIINEEKNKYWKLKKMKLLCQMNGLTLNSLFSFMLFVLNGHLGHTKLGWIRKADPLFHFCNFIWFFNRNGMDSGHQFHLKFKYGTTLTSQTNIHYLCRLDMLYLND